MTLRGRLPVGLTSMVTTHATRAGPLARESRAIAETGTNVEDTRACLPFNARSIRAMTSAAEV